MGLEVHSGIDPSGLPASSSDAFPRPSGLLRNNYPDVFNKAPKGMASGASQIRELEPKSNDGGVRPNCACALLECWFADFPKTQGEKWKSDVCKELDSEGRFVQGRGWLEDEGKTVIAAAIARGIKRYIDSLSSN